MILHSNVSVVCVAELMCAYLCVRFYRVDYCELISCDIAFIYIILLCSSHMSCRACMCLCVRSISLCLCFGVIVILHSCTCILEMIIISYTVQHYTVNSYTAAQESTHMICNTYSVLTHRCSDAYINGCIH